MFGDKIICKNIWKTIHSGLIDNWDLNIIYKLIHQVIAVRKNLYLYWRIAPTPECRECSDVDSVLHAFFYCAKTNNFIKQVEPIFKKRFGDNFKLNVYLIAFGRTHKIGNNVSKLGHFFWSKVIKTIWICRKLLEKSKPCNEMDIFENFYKTKNRNGAFCRFRKRWKKRKLLKLLVILRHPCNLHGRLRVQFMFMN